MYAGDNPLLRTRLRMAKWDAVSGLGLEGVGVMYQSSLAMGLKIISSPYALKDTDQRLFPMSRHRSKRVHKKLVHRFGSEFRKQPCIFRTADTLIVHPSLYAEVVKQTRGNR
jgi:hypothetical protein